MIGDVPGISESESLKFIGENEQGYCLYSWVWQYSPLPEADTNVCSFFEYNARENGFRVVATFSFYAETPKPELISVNSPAEELTGAIVASQSIQADSSSASNPNTEIMERAASQVKQIVNSIEDFDSDDGPLFRATLSAMEKKTNVLKQNLKKVIKCVQNLVEKDKEWMEAEAALTESFKAIPALSVAAEYLDQSSSRLTDNHETYIQQIQTLLLEPLKKLYENDVKNADAKKREFDADSEDFYSFLSKYLSRKNFDKKKNAYDQKYLLKKRVFDLKRFDYFSFIQDLHGRKDQEILYHVSGFCEREANYYRSCASSLNDIDPTLKNLSKQVEENTRSISHALKEREEKRKLIDSKFLAANMEGLPASFAAVELLNNNSNIGFGINTSLNSNISNNSNLTPSTYNNSLNNDIVEDEGNKFRGKFGAINHYDFYIDSLMPYRNP